MTKKRSSCASVYDLVVFLFFLGNQGVGDVTALLVYHRYNIALETLPYDLKKTVRAICLSKMSASFPIKCHLPLITTRIEFKFNVLPAPPHITPRRDFGAHIRRQNRRDSVTPYSRSTHFRNVTPARSQSPSEHFSDGEKGFEKIRKPPGEAGRVNSGGYDLQTALGWDYEQYNKFTVSYRL